MDSLDAEVFFDELIHRCDEALEAIGQLNYALINLYQVPSGGSWYDTIKQEIFGIIDVFLTKASILSGMLWPDRRAYGRHGLTKDQAIDPDIHCPPAACYRGMKKSLGAVYCQTMKNLMPAGPFHPSYLQHLDRTKPWKIFRIIGSPIAVINYPSMVGVQIYDPTTRNLYTDGQIFPLQEIAAAIEKLQKCADAELKQQRKRYRLAFSDRLNDIGLKFMKDSPLY
jgi:hypothetical protein